MSYSVGCYNKRLRKEMPTCHGNQEHIDTLFDLLQGRISKKMDSKHNVDNLLHIFSVSARCRDGFSKQEADKMKRDILNSLNNQHNLYECYCKIIQFCDSMGLSTDDVWHCFTTQFDKAAYDSNKELMRELRQRLFDRVGYKPTENLEV